MPENLMTADSLRSPLVPAEWLARHRDDPGLRLVDASFKMPRVSPTARADYTARHIPGAVFFDIDAVADQLAPLPHMLPDPGTFATAVGALGIGNEDRVVLYDANGFAGAARAWWTFRVFGHDRVSVLDGGLKAWTAVGQPVDDAVPAPEPRRFEASFRPELVCDRAAVLANLDTHTAEVIDARAAGRFTGAVPEPRAGLRSGHIPGSRNVDHLRLVDAATGLFKAPTAIEDEFRAAGVDLSRPLITSCGSGVTASVLALGLFHLGRDDVAVYDGSWSEWGLPGETPVATGPATGPAA